MYLLTLSSHIDRAEAHVLAALRARGLKLLVMCRPETANLDVIREAGIPVKPLCLKGRIDRDGIAAIQATLAAHPASVIHSFNKNALSNALLATKGMSIRHTTYRGIVGNLSPWNPETRLLFFNRRVAHIVCVCEAVRQSLLEIGVSPAKAVRIYKGHKPEWYQPAQRQALSALGPPPDATILGSAARWRPRKGLSVLLRALCQLSRPDLHLVVAGKIPARDKKWIMQHPLLKKTVHLTGDTPDAPALMGACDLFIMPSLRREGLAKSVIEAMIQGVPAIVSHSGGLAEIVPHEVGGLVVPPGNVKHLAMAIQRLTDDQPLRQTFRTGALDHIRRTFPFEQTVTQYQDLFLSLA